MNTDSTPNGSSESQTSHHKRSREEMEALAKNFVGTPTEEVAPVKPRARIAMMAAGAVAVVAILAVVFWPKGRSEAGRAQADSARAAAAADAEQWQKRFEAERERKRQELASGKEYMDRMAAADAALLKEFSEQASRLADRVASMPAASDAPPTPRATAAAKPAPAPSQPAPAPTQQAPTQTASTAPAKPAPTPAAPQPEAAKPAATAPTEVAQADKASCSIHVSELTKSGKLTYADVKRMKGARFDEETGHVFTPPVQAAGGQRMIFEVMPNGCVTVKRS